MAMNLPEVSGNMDIVLITRRAVTSAYQQSSTEKHMISLFPATNRFRVGTLHGILKDVAEHHEIHLEQVVMDLFE